jgi:hypothetical protein
MSAHSTLRVTRSKAKAFLIDKITNGLSDKELESLMDNILYDRLYNCMIVSDECEHPDDHVI